MTRVTDMYIMRNAQWILAFILLTLSSVPSFADDAAKGVCKITTKTYFVKGSTKVDVDEVPASDRKACKKMADDRRINKNPEEIANITTGFGFSNPE